MWKLPFRKRRKSARLPAGICVYAVGDIHGRIDLLDKLLAKIDADARRKPAARTIEIYLGDYVDRGPASREVIDRLLARSDERETVFLKGNHEAFLQDFLQRPEVLADWSQCGGLQTLSSYGLTPSFNPSGEEPAALSHALKAAFPAAHEAFLKRLSMYFECGDFFFVHAGIRPGVPLDQQEPEDLLWIREEFLLCEDAFKKMIVHGHTPVTTPEFRPNRINIDTGAYATGLLTCLRIEDDQYSVL